MMGTLRGDLVMHKICYSINRLPDLSLNKYQGLENQGSAGLISLQNQMFNLLQKYSLINEITFSLFYRLNTSRKKGMRIEVGLEFVGEIDKLEYLKKLIVANPINIYYCLNLIEYSDINNNYFYCGIVKKREKFVKNLANSFNNSNFFQISSWKPIENNRYISLLRLMGLLNDDIIIRIDFKSVDYFQELEEAIINVNKNLLSNQSYNHKDESVNKIIKYNDNLLKEYSKSPQMKCYIYAFGKNKTDVNVVLNSLCSELIENGEYEIAIFDENIYANSIDVFFKNNEKLTNRICIYKDYNDVYNLCLKETYNIDLGYLPTLFTVEEIRPFFRLPILFENEVVEIPKETSNLLMNRKVFDKIELAIDEAGYNVSIPLDDLNKHLFICGIPGSGKTTTMHRILIELANKNIPFLVFEPAKTEYRELIASGLENIFLFSPKPQTLFELEINPFEFPEGMSLSEHISNLLSVFTGAFYFPVPTPIIIEEAIENIYKEKGWDLLEINSGGKIYPTLIELKKEIEIVIRNKKYSDENKENMIGICEIRLSSLLKREKSHLFGADCSTIKPKDWIRISSIIELESLDSNTANFLTLLISTFIRETLKIELVQEQNRPRHVILFEEAHNLITSNLEIGEETANIKVASTKYIIKMLAEVRALKEGIIIADQLPSAMAPEIIKNTSTKIIHKITANDELEKVAQTTNANSIQLENVSVFDKGEILLDVESLIKPFKCRVINVNSHGKEMLNDNDLYINYKQGKSYQKLLLYHEEQNKYRKMKKIYTNYFEIINFYYEKIIEHLMVLKEIKHTEKDNNELGKSLGVKYLRQSEKDINSIENIIENVKELKNRVQKENNINESLKINLNKKIEKIIDLIKKCAEILINNTWVQ